MATDPINWTQACLVQVDKVQFSSFTRSVYVSDSESTSATATLFANATSTGDCGSAYNTVCTLVGEDGSSVNVPISTEDMLSVAGGSATVDVGRDTQGYTFSCSVSATTPPQTAEEHQADTANVGFNNVDVASAVAVGTSLAPICNIEIESFEFGSYSEQSDWTGSMLATYSGSIYAEAACSDVAATLKFMDCETAVYLTTQSLTLVAPAEGSLIWTFTATVESLNEFGYYYGALHAFSAGNEADDETATTDCELWSPPCYLEVVNFDKTGQV